MEEQIKNKNHSYPHPISLKKPSDINIPVVIANYYKDGYFYDFRGHKYCERGYELSSNSDICKFIKD